MIKLPSVFSSSTPSALRGCVGIWSMGGVAQEIHNVEVATAGPMESMYLSRPEECGVLL